MTAQESPPTPPPSAPEPTAQRLSEAASEFFMQPTVEATLEAIVRNAVDILQASDAALITSRRSSLDIGVSTTEQTGKVDWFQFKLSEGPCVTALQDRIPIVVQDISGEPRWPSWAHRAAEVGFHSMVAVPLLLQPSHAAALSVYWDRPARLGHEHVVVAVLIARHASIAVDKARQSSTLREAIDARHQIGLAQGILMERFGLSAQQSFDVLRRHSRDNNIKLRKIAAEVVATRSLPGTTTVREERARRHEW
jgi:GAF domain-containing protein